jgi:hypothetical protein
MAIVHTDTGTLPIITRRRCITIVIIKIVKSSAQLVNIFQVAPVFLASPATDALVT